jgi:hypothetical protein
MSALSFLKIFIFQYLILCLSGRRDDLTESLNLTLMAPAKNVAMSGCQLKTVWRNCNSDWKSMPDSDAFIDTCAGPMA